MMEKELFEELQESIKVAGQMKREGELKDIPGFPGYAITRDGRVWSKPRRGTVGGWMKPQKVKGYLQVILGQGSRSKRKYRYIHQLVLETFVGPRPKGMQACHNNGNREDNRFENLRWDTASENVKDAVRQGTHSILQQKGENHHKSKLKEDDIRVIRYLRDVAKFTLADIAWHFDVSLAQISNIVRRKNWKHV